MCAQLYGVDDPGMSEEDFLDILEEFGRNCERYRFLTPNNIDENYGFKIDESSFAVIDTCDSITGWNYGDSATAPALTSFKREGTGAIKLGKIAGTKSAFYEKEISLFDGSNKEIMVWVYIDDINLLASSGTAIKISLIDETFNSAFHRNYTQTQISIGWNLLGGFLLEDFEQEGIPDISKLKKIKITLYTSNDDDEIPSGSIIMDYWRVIGKNQANYSIDRQTLIITPITERDAKLIEAGFANIGDFKVFAPYSYDIKAHDIIYDALKNMYLELEQVSSIPTVQVTGICKIFIGKVTNRPIPP